MLCYSSEDMQRQPIGLWEVARDELDLRFHEVGDEGEVSAEAV